MVTVYLVKNLRYGHAEVCLADRSYAMLLKIFVKIKNTEASLRRYRACLPPGKSRIQSQLCNPEGLFTEQL
jgi:hypothetical protein